MWQAISLVFPGVAILGCYFQWAQVVWLKAQEYGLQCPYATDNKTHKFIHKLLSLPIFHQNISAQSSMHLIKKQLLNHLENLLITSTTPGSIAQFGL